ncbi:MAG: NYN domain-containing protein, partial [Erysipelotrichia bacterium]|nr:NYN domain-containing protein [Erysipelotrichia bacterium]
MDNNGYKIALMIDSENVSPKYIKPVMNEIAKYGKIVIARFYGDINNLSKEWHKTATDHAIKPVHQYNVAIGKNAADMAMALDAQEMMYQEKVNAFFLVTSDSDFTPLAVKLREGGMHVIG